MNSVVDSIITALVVGALTTLSTILTIIVRTVKRYIEQRSAAIESQFLRVLTAEAVTAVEHLSQYDSALRGQKKLELAKTMVRASMPDVPDEQLVPVILADVDGLTSKEVGT